MKAKSLLALKSDRPRQTREGGALEEVWELRQALEAGDMRTALAIVDEMEEMSRDDKIEKIASSMRVLLIHKINQAVEDRSTKSWEVSMRHALRQMVSVNKRRKAGGWYLNEDDLAAFVAEAYEAALDWASLETHEGIYSIEELATMHDRQAVLAETLLMIQEAQRAQVH